MNTTRTPCTGLSHWRSPIGAIFALVLLVVIPTIARFVALSSDPPSLVLTDHLTDEGWYTQNARNHYLFQSWVLDDHNPALVLTPVFTLIQRLVMEMVGVSFWSVRVISAIASALVIILVCLRLRDKPKWMIATGSLLALNPLLFAYSRVAFVEPLQLAFLSAAWFFVTDSRQRLTAYAAAGAMAVLAITTKPTAAVIATFVLAAPWIGAAPASIRQKLDRTGAAVVGGIFALLPLAVFVAQFPIEFMRELSRESSIVAGSGGFEGLATPLFLGFKPEGDGFVPMASYWVVVAPLLGAGAVRVVDATSASLCDPVRESTQANRIAQIAFAWIVLALLTLSIQAGVQFRPRHWLNLLVPISILLPAGGFTIWTPLQSDSVRTWVSALMLSLVFRPSYEQLVERLLGHSNSVASTLVLLVLILVWTAVFVHPVRSLLHRIPATLRRGQVMSRRIVLAICVVWAGYCAHIALTPTFTIRNASRFLGERLSDEAVLTGATANTLVLETDLFAYETRDLASMGMGEGYLNADPRRFGTTHVITTLVEPDADATNFLDNNGLREPDMPFAADFEFVTRRKLVPLRGGTGSYRYLTELYRISGTQPDVSHR